MEILGLDINTKIIGWVLVNQDTGNLTKTGIINIEKCKGIYNKANYTKRIIYNLIEDHPIDTIAIENSLKSSSKGSSHSLALLNKFNGIISYICYELTNKEPLSLDVYAIRERCGIFITGKMERQEIKNKIYSWASKKEPDIFKKYAPGTKGWDDIADAYAVAMSAYYGLGYKSMKL